MTSFLAVAILVIVVSGSSSAPAKVCPNHHVTHGLPATNAVSTTTTKPTTPKMQPTTPTTKPTTPTTPTTVKPTTPTTPTTKPTTPRKPTTPTTPTTKPSTTTTPTCQKLKDSVPFYRAYQTDVHDHFYTTNAAEYTAAVKNGYKDEGIVGFILPAKAPNTVELYRLYHAERHDHFYTTSQPERANAIAQLGYKDEGIAGYVYQAPNGEPRCPCPEVRPLYRVHNAQIVDHFYTMDAAEKSQTIGQLGYSEEGIAACIYPPA